MPGPIAAIRVSSDSAFDKWMVWAILLAFVVSILIKSAGMLWPYLVRSWNNRRSRDWPTVSGVIDIAAVTKQVHSGGRGSTYIDYLALLTYSYRNPDLQTGDYNRLFNTEWDAQDWVESCKGRTVTVHVDPRDPTRSVLRTEDL